MAYPLTLRYASTIGSIASGPLSQLENSLSHMSSPLEGSGCTVGVDQLRIKRRKVQCSISRWD